MIGAGVGRMRRIRIPRYKKPPKTVYVNGRGTRADPVNLTIDSLIFSDLCWFLNILSRLSSVRWVKSTLWREDGASIQINSRIFLLLLRPVASRLAKIDRTLHKSTEGQSIAISDDSTKHHSSKKMLVDGTLIIESSQIAVLLAYIVTTYQAQTHRGGGITSYPSNNFAMLCRSKLSKEDATELRFESKV
jgi:hypothetical protein